MNINPPRNAIEICRTLHDAGFESYLVGGAVRDSLIGRNPNDWDIATNALPIQVASCFGKVIETGIEHGTVTVIIDGDGFEVTTYRIDGDYSDGRRPDSVLFSNSITEDLARRDFTMNAIAYDPLSGDTVDPFFGVRDIENRIVRAVGNPDDRLREDTLRALRAVRFASVLEFDIDRPTLDAISRCKLSVSAERIRVELVKGLCSVKPSRFLVILRRFGLLEQIIPELLPAFGCGQNKYHEHDVWCHTLLVTDATPNTERLRLAGMLHDVSKPSVKGAHPVTGEATFYEHEKVGADVTDAILRRLKFSNEDRERIVSLVRHHLVPELKSPASVRRWVRKVGTDNVADIIALAKADHIGKGNPECIGMTAGYLDNLAERISTMREESTMVTDTVQLAVNGSDVMLALGIGPGPMVGAKLREMLELVIDDPSLNERSTLLDMLSA